MADDSKIDLSVKLITLEKIRNKGDLSYLMLDQNNTILLPNSQWTAQPPQFPNAGEIVKFSVKGNWNGGNPPKFVGGIVVYDQGSTLFQGNNRYQFYFSMDTMTGNITAPTPGGGPWPYVTWSVQTGMQEVTFVQKLV